MTVPTLPVPPAGGLAGVPPAFEGALGGAFSVLMEKFMPSSVASAAKVLPPALAFVPFASALEPLGPGWG